MISVSTAMAIEWVFLLYFAGLHVGYLILNIIAIINLTRYMDERILDELPQVNSGFEPPISVLVPAYNEEATIVSSIRSLLHLSYTDFEIVIINDGSRDRTFEVISKEFSLTKFPEAYRIRLPTKPILGLYQSSVYKNLRVVDKVNGGKADALNAGINAARHPLFCGIDADSILQRESLQRVVQPFLEDSRVIACGGTIRVANGCNVRSGFLVSAGLPKNMLGLLQIVEYLRAFLFGRLGWSPMNALLVISGAFGLFHKDTVVSVGGYRTDTVGEDMELVVRLHRKMREQKRPYRIAYVPDPICWTEAPEDLKTLRNQRVRWQRGLSESLSKNLGLLFCRNGGMVGRVAFPFMVIFEWLGPLLELSGYAFTLVAYLMGLLTPSIVIVFLFLSVGFGLLLSVTALLLEELSFHIYPRQRHLLYLLFAAIIENLGYRQLNMYWRLTGLFKWALKRESRWGEMVRRASWNQS
jgi:cellulose synthase/poly-beta-1,6-N-acetylglucosamine synthase-like glycosyltransferase